MVLGDGNLRKLTSLGSSRTFGIFAIGSYLAGVCRRCSWLRGFDCSSSTRPEWCLPAVFFGSLFISCLRRFMMVKNRGDASLEGVDILRPAYGSADTVLVYCIRSCGGPPAFAIRSRHERPPASSRPGAAPTSAIPRCGRNAVGIRRPGAGAR